MNGKKALWVIVGLLFVGAIVVAAVLGTRGGGGTIAPLPDAAGPPKPAASPPDAAPPPKLDASPINTVGGGAVPDAAPADAGRPVDAAAIDGAPAADAGAHAVEAAPPPPGAAIQFDEPRVVGDVDPQPILDVLAKLETFESCRPKGAATAQVKVQFHVGLGGLRLAAPAADNAGDASVARCIANRVKSAKPTWKQDESGIIIVDATVPPKP